MKRTLRWLKRIVLALSALVVLLVGIAIGLVHTDWGRNKIRAQIVDALQADFPGSTIGSLAGSPFGTLVLTDVTLVARDGKPLVKVKQAAVRAALTPLASHRVEIEDITVAGVEVFVREQPSKPPAKPTATGPSEPSAWTIDLPQIAVDNVRVTLETTTGVEVIDELRVRAAVRIPSGQAIAASASVQGRWREKPLVASVFAAIDGGVVKVPFASVQLGDGRVAASGVIIEPDHITGSVRAEIPAALVRELANIELPGDVVLTARADGNGAITLDGSAGSARVQGDVVADLAAKRGKGIVIADVPDLALVTHGERTGAGTLVAALSGDATRVSGLVTISGAVDGRAGTTTLALAASETHAEVVATADAKEGAGEAHAVANRIGDVWTLADATVRARVHDVGGVRDGRADVTASGPLWPAPQLTIAATADATDYRERATRVAGVHADVHAVATKERQTFDATVTATGVRSGTTHVGTARAGLRGEATEAAQHVDATVNVADIRSGSTRVPSAVIASEIDRTDGLIALALGAHRVRTADGSTWSGTGGRVTVTDQAVVVDNVRTASAHGRVTASARIGRLDRSLSAKVTARDVALAAVDPELGGTVDADLDVTRRGVSWGGSASVRAKSVAVKDRPAVDAAVDVKLAGRKITLAGNVSSPQLGSTTVAVAVTGPADITNARAWRKLQRTAIDKLDVTIASFDAAPLGAAGKVDGQLALGPTEATGELHVRGVTTKAGAVDADVTIKPGANGAIDVAATAQTAGIRPSNATATFVLPARPFDPDAWKLLGTGALKAATLETGTIHIDQALLDRFGVVSPYSADVAATVTVGEGAKVLAASVDVRGLSGGKLTQLVDIDVDVGADATGLHAEGSARSGSATVAVSAKSPMTIEQLLAPNAPPAPIEATATIPDMRAKDLLGLLGETDVLAGVVGGKVTVTGTVAEPDIRANLFARGFALKASSITNKPPPTLDNLVLDARYTREHAELTLTGTEAEGRMLTIRAAGDPRKPRGVSGSLEAANFDLAPLAAFGTGPVRAARGTLSGALKIKGFDPTTGSVRGQIAIRDFRFPLTPELGTLRRGSLVVDVVGQKLKAEFDGRLGAGNGSITGTLTSVLQGGVPQSAHLEAKVKKVSPIGALQPQIDADLVGNWADVGHRWEGSLAVRNGKIFVPPETGTELLMTGAPSDMIFVDKKIVAKKVRRPPTKPFLVSRIAIGNTDVDLQDADARVRLTLRGDLMLEVGDGVGLRGQINTVKGTAELFGRRYRIEQGMITYDGATLDPRLNIRVVHDFKNLTLTAEVGGTASRPDPRLRGDPDTYAEGQLWSFLLGAEPGSDDSGAQAGQAVVSGGLSILSGRVSQKLNKYLPVKLDTINYEAGTATSSKAVRFGKQLTEKAYLVWRQRLAARPDENPGEAVIEYQFRPNFLFEGTIGERNKGGDFLWRKRATTFLGLFGL